MRKNTESFKKLPIKPQRTVSINGRENNKKQQFQNIVNLKQEKEGQDELISNAYKNVINVPLEHVISGENCPFPVPFVIPFCTAHITLL